MTNGCSDKHVALGPLVLNLFIQCMVFVLLCNINVFIRKQWTVTLNWYIYHASFKDQ